MNRFSDTMPMTPKRMPREVSVQEADAAIRASWPARSGAALHLVQPMAAEASTDVYELPAADEYAWHRSEADNAAAAVFWRRYLLAAALFASAAGVWRFWPA